MQRCCVDPHDAEFGSVLEAARDGAEWAWAQIYRDHAGPVTGYLRNRGAREPEDLTSEAFLRVARTIHTFSGDAGSFRSWVFVIAHRLLIDERRYHGRRPDLTEFDDLAAKKASGDIEDEAMEQLVTAEIFETFRALTEAQRDVLALRIVAGLTLEQTAQVLGKRTGAVKALQHRALETLKRVLDEENVTL